MPLPVSAAASIGIDAMRANPMRAVLSTLGVIIGVAALVGVLSLGDGMELTMRETVATSTGLQNLAISARTNEVVEGELFPLRDTVRLSQRDLLALKELPGVAGAALVTQRRVELSPGDTGRRRMVALSATGPGFLAVSGEHVAQGRFLTAGDSTSAVAVISASLARHLSSTQPGTPVLGRALALGGETRTVIGVLDGDSTSRTLQAVIPLRVPSESAGIPRAQLALRATRVEDVAVLEDSVRAYFKRRAGGAREAVDIATYRLRAEQTAKAILIFKLLMGAITGISLLVGGIGIMNVLLASVTERTREIGIRKAAGARQRDILMQFLAESVAITGLGGAIGVALGLLMSFGVTAGIRALASAPFVRSSVSWSTVLAAAIASVLIGLAFGTYPARRAARLSPIDAIRHE